MPKIQNDINEMVAKARSARAKAYAPYSEFHVGACLRTSSGQYFIGCNVENASYGLACCAEATAISAMIMAGEQTIDAIAVIGSSDEICTPCGACRQRILEFSHDDTAVIMANTQGETITSTMAELVPLPFGTQLPSRRSE